MIPTKWQKLLTQLEIVGSNWFCSSKLDIQEFESQTSIILPADYKDFCQIFGYGRFNEAVIIGNVIHLKQFIKLYWKDRTKTHQSYEYDLEETWEDCLETKLRWQCNHDQGSKMERFYEFINSALEFASGPDCRVYWDLTTSSVQDTKYDIYIGDWGNYEMFKIGRDFFAFVTDYCLGLKYFDFLPERFRPKRSDFYNLFETYYYEELSLREQRENARVAATLKLAQQ